MSIRNPSESKAAALARMKALIAGLQKHNPNGQFTLGGVPFTETSLVQLFQRFVDAIDEVTATQARATEAVAAMRALEAEVSPVFLNLKSSLLNTCGPSATTLADYGLEPPKARTPLTSEQQAAAVVKARATRQARGTTSKKQKSLIKGEVSGIVVTPITTTTTL